MHNKTLVVYGEPASKANSRRINFKQRRSFKSAKALDYCDAFRLQTKPMLPLFEGDVVVTMHIYYASRRPDLDEALILDLLQGVTYANDRAVKEKHIYHHLDKERPRTEIEVAEL